MILLGTSLAGLILFLAGSRWPTVLTILVIGVAMHLLAPKES